MTLLMSVPRIVGQMLNIQSMPSHRAPFLEGAYTWFLSSAVAYLKFLIVLNKWAHIFIFNPSNDLVDPGSTFSFTY